MQSADEINAFQSPGPQPYKQFSRFKEIIHQVNEAIITREQIDIRYYIMSRREMTKRMVAPYKLWYHDGGFYLNGHCSRRLG